MDRAGSSLGAIIANGEGLKSRLKVYELSNLRERDRAARLRTEAGNCVSIAVRESTEAFAAQLIDEAARLMKRSAELSKKAGATGDGAAPSADRDSP